MMLIRTSTADKLLRGVNIDDLEWPWTPKIGDYSKFFATLDSDTHFKSELNCAEMARDRRRKPAHEIFNIECRF